ncbi:MAG: DUF2141 domain-containing protein [Cyclobacteriaceae bacterium]|nr:DUF2141 domain-containing protein [Cyclobacteriaceae bacterium HetDA_MAG_MS6]
MKLTKLIISIVFMLSASLLVAQGKINVRVNEIETDKGDILVNLYASGDGFPNDLKKAHQFKKVSPQKGSVSVIFENVPYGTYAVSIAHDENQNGEIDTNLIGFPKEPVGASNQDSFGRPTFKKSQFSLSQEIPMVNLEIGFLN